MKPIVSVIMGSRSDLKSMKQAVEVLKHFKIPHEVKIVSAHRTPQMMQSFASRCKERGIQVIIAGAGGAAHLPGMVASLTSLPVVGVPIKTQALDGIDSLLSIAQMPKGVPVASMAIDGAFNGGLMAVRILSINNSTLSKKIDTFHKKQMKESIKSSKKIKT